MHEEKIICCKPCGLNVGSGGQSDTSLVNLCQAIMRLAKRHGVTTGYWEDMFYLSLDAAVPNREQICATLSDRYQAKLLSSSVCERRASYDEAATSTLVERWNVPDAKMFTA